MELNPLQLEYLDIREFLFKYFSIDLNPIGILSIIFQLGLLGWVVLQIYRRFKGTQAERVLRGLISLLPIVVICYILKLSILTHIVEILSSTILLGLVVIFAPEFRRVLMQLGGQFSSLDFVVIPESRKKIIQSVNELVEAIKELQSHKMGALIVLEKAKVDRYYVNPGQPINANLSQELLLSIFSSRAPLHDGAVTIRGSNIVNARVILPMTENPKLDWQYGTRHRAAIGFTEVTDSLCIVVSEESGEISLAYQGILVKHTVIDEVKAKIEQFYSTLVENKKRSNKITQQLYDLFKKKKHSSK